MIVTGKSRKAISLVSDICNDVVIYASEDGHEMKIFRSDDSFKLPESNPRQVSLSGRKLLLLFGKASLYASNDVASDSSFPNPSIGFTKLETPQDLTEILTILSLDNCHLLLALNGKTGKKELWSYIAGPCACHGQGDSPQERLWTRCLVDP